MDSRSKPYRIGTLGQDVLFREKAESLAGPARKRRTNTPTGGTSIIEHRAAPEEAHAA